MSDFESFPGADNNNVAEALLSAILQEGELSAAGLRAVISQSRQEVAKGNNGAIYDDPDGEFKVIVSDEQVAIAYPGIDEIFLLALDTAQRIIDTHDVRFD